MRELVDNFEPIKDLLPSAPMPDTFWVVRVISRRKDNPDLYKNSKFIKSYTVQCKDDLDKLRGSIIESCQKYNARGYFNPNARSWRKMAMATLKRIADYISYEDYKSVQFAAERSLEDGAAPDFEKIWIVDVDDPAQADEFDRCMAYIRPFTGIVQELDTVNGSHILVKPFNPQLLWDRWNSEIERPEIKKNNPTLLYFNKMWDDEE